MSYGELTARLRERVRACVPAGSRVLVVSRGDDGLVRIDGVRAGHFPQSPTGQYAGYHPADGGEAVRHLLELREGGASHLVLPATALWWLEHYRELRALLDGFRLVLDEPETCLVYELSAPAEVSAPGTRDDLEAARVAPQAAAIVAALLPPEAGVVVLGRAAPLVELAGRPCWRIGTPTGEGLTDPAGARREVEAARAAGAQALVLVHADRPSDCLDARVRAAVASGLRAICTQRLVECFELRAMGGAGG